MIVDHRNVGAAFRRLSLPSAVQMLGDQLLGVVDTIAIGSLGAVALAGATAATTVMLALSFFIFGFLTGLGIIAAQRVGAHDLEGFARSVRAGFLVPVLCAVICAGLSIPFAGMVVGEMIGHLPSAHASAIYLIVRCFSMIPMAISGTLIVGLGAAGNRALGVLVLAVVNLVHIPLLLILALGMFTHHPYGIVGAGVSSLLSETIAALYAIVYVYRRPIYRVFETLRVDLRLAFECARLGLPEAVFLFAVIAPDSFIVAMLAPLGAIAISAFRALNVVSDLTFIVPSPMQQAVQTVIGQRLGAGDVEGARWFFARSRLVSFRITTLTGVVTALLAWPLAYLFTLNTVVASAAAWPLALQMVTLPIKGWAMVSMSPIRASGDTRFSMAAGLITSVLVIPLSFLFIKVTHIGLLGVPIAWVVAWLARLLLTVWKLRGESWTRRGVISVSS
ncbi:MAG TPA: MATE family efflux transporter [Candidatus Baltobacteraceae bacterium]|nr:MATE family efflux transporter [Candidatus Baltobacteraceae bacterium]